MKLVFLLLCFFFVFVSFQESIESFPELATLKSRLSVHFEPLFDEKAMMGRGYSFFRSLIGIASVWHVPPASVAGAAFSTWMPDEAQKVSDWYDAKVVIWWFALDPVLRVSLPLCAVLYIIVFHEGLEFKNSMLTSFPGAPFAWMAVVFSFKVGMEIGFANAKKNTFW